MWILASSSSRTVKSAIECRFTHHCASRDEILVRVLHRREVTDTNGHRGRPHVAVHTVLRTCQAPFWALCMESLTLTAPRRWLPAQALQSPAAPPSACPGLHSPPPLAVGKRTRGLRGSGSQEILREKDTVLQNARDGARVLNLTRTAGWGHWLGTKWQNMAGVDPSPCS